MRGYSFAKVFGIWRSPILLRKTLPSMKSCFSTQTARLTVALLMLLLAPIIPVEQATDAAPAPSGSSIEMSQDWYMVIDRAGILDEGQERSAINDAYRLNLYGIPTQVVTEPVALNQAQADARADERRIIDEIESAPWADDGLLVYVSVDPYDQTNIVMSISVGGLTLPRNGLNTETLNDIRDRIVTDQLAQGHPARAIVYSLREMIYFEQYVPPPAPVLNRWKADVNRMADVVVPLSSVAGVGWLIRSRHRSGGGQAASTRVILALSSVALAMIVLAIQTRSSPAVLAAALLGTMVAWQAVRLDQDRVRAIVTTPRPPGSRLPATLSRATEK